jgi:hypothetical protein
MLVEIAGDQLYFETVSRSGKVIDSGTVARPSKVEDSKAAAAAN